MKRSRTVELFLVLSAAAAVNGCGADQVRRCVDGNNTVVDDQNCSGKVQSDSYRWYYGGPNGTVAVGSHVSGGSVTPNGEAESATSHGVIGGAGEAHGAVGGEGAGAGE